MRHLPRPARHHLVPFGHLVLNAESHVGEGAPVELDRPLHPSQTVRRVGIVWVVVYDVARDQLV